MLCTVEDVEALLGSDITAETDRVTDLILQAQGIIEGVSGRRFDEVIDVEITTDGLNQQDGVIWLETYPLAAVAIEDASGAPFTVDSQFTWQSGGRIRRLGVSAAFAWAWESLSSPSWPVGTTITYSGGFPVSAVGVPRDLRTLAAQVTVDLFSHTSQNVRQESLGPWSASYAPRSGNLSEQQAKIAQKYRRVRHSVPMI